MMKKFSDILYRDGLGLDLTLPEADHFPLFLYFHGGGLEHGSKERGVGFSRELLKDGIAFASADYRMYPNASYPDFLNDAAAAVAFLHRHIGEYGKCDGIYVGGSSAGAYLSMMLCFCDDLLGAHGMEPTDVAGWVHDSGQPTAHYRVLAAKGIDSRRVIVDETAPLYWVGTGRKKPSPMLILVSDEDMENRFEQTELTFSTLRHFGLGDVAKPIVMHGTHCSHLEKTDEAGNYIFGGIIRDFIRNGIAPAD